MAKLVIAGKANCPHYAKIELLADQLASNLGSFNLHKIVKKPEEWDDWIEKTCSERSFSYKQSPVVWRELVDRGGKGILIGGSNEFQEYANGYYGVKSDFTSLDMKKVADENMTFKQKADEEAEHYKSLSEPMKICISNASSDVSYHLVNNLVSGEVFGKNTELIVNLLDCEENLPYLAGIEMEIMDLAHNLLREVCVTSNAHQAFTDCQVVILLDQLTRGDDETEESWLTRNSEAYSEKAKLIEENCLRDVKVLLASTGPINTALYMMHKNIRKLSKRNIVALPRLTENQAKAIIARKVKVNSADVVDVVCWGDQEKYFCDVTNARVHNHDGPIWGPPFYSRLASLLIHEEPWLQKDFVEALQSREATEREMLKKAPAFSRAAAATTFMNQWWNGSPEGQVFTLTVASEGWYDVPEDMVFNFPVRLLPAGNWVVADDIDLNEESQAKIQECIQYLLEQRYVIFPDQRPTPPPEPEKPVEISDSPHPPTMTPIKEETDNEIPKQSEQTTSDEVTDYVTDTDHPPAVPEEAIPNAQDQPEVTGQIDQAEETAPTMEAVPIEQTQEKPAEAE